MANPSAAANRFGWNLLFIGLSIIFGTGVWLVVQLVQRGDITLEIPVVVDTGDRTDIDFTYKPERVQVRFTFPEVERNKMSSENFRVHVPFQEIVEGLDGSLDKKTDTVPISRDMVLPQNAAEINMGERNIAVSELLQPQVKWEAAYRQIPAEIKPVVTGEAAAGYAYDSQKAVIEQGSERTTAILSLEKEQELRDAGIRVLTLNTKPLDVTGKANIVRELVQLDLPEGVHLLPDDPGDRMVMVDITERIETRTIEDVPVQYEFLSKRESLVANLTPPAVSVKITGRRSAINKLTPQMLIVNPILGKTERAGIEREVSVRVLLDREAARLDPHLETGIEKLEAEPATVVVRITSDETEAPEDAVPSATPTPVPTPELPVTPEATAVPATPVATPVPAPNNDSPSTPVPTVSADDAPTS